MDPNEALKMLRGFVREARRHKGLDVRSSILEDLSDTLEALDEWLSGGGFEPDDWDKNTIMGRQADRDMKGHPT